LSPLPLLLLTGASGAGKSCACALVRRAVVVSADDYYLEEGDGRIPTRRGRPDWNRPQSLDWAALRRDVNLIRRGEAIPVPVYDMRTSRRAPRPRTVTPGDARAVLVEGIFSFSLEDHRSPATKILLDCPRSVLFWRRIRRDVREERRPPLPAAAYSLSQYSFDARLRAAARAVADVVLDGRLPPPAIASRLDHLASSPATRGFGDRI
jgi:uridine kinase